MNWIAAHANWRIGCTLYLLLVAPSSFAPEIISEGSGSADVTYDGTTSQYTLQIGFGMDTDFSNPAKFIALFSKSSFQGSSSKRAYIQIRLVAALGAVATLPTGLL